MNNLRMAKQLIRDNFKYGMYGLFNCRNTVGDTMTILYRGNTLGVDICYDYEYFEVFGLTEEEFEELETFYITLWRKYRQHRN